ncbi:hypothetical protein [Magnetospirillum sp. UT-4]|uniref:hypothetical protein n=1 Tax=Magnetospirillum sp. UT-4 TaxID=2681467 RepID=UPI0015721CB8|nr:hypothetical protein [Magnetospirillum sp. UT-4]
MRVADAAIGLAAVGAGWLVARALLRRRSATGYVGGNPEHRPPSPERLIGLPPGHRRAGDSAEVLAGTRPS